MKKSAIISDLDGTISLLNGRDPYKYHLSKYDLPNTPLINKLKEHKNDGYYIIILSGRGNSVEKITKKWLEKYEVPYNELYLKPDTDRRSSVFYKREILEKNIIPFYDIKLAYDDYHKNLTMFKEYNIHAIDVIEYNEGIQR